MNCRDYQHQITLLLYEELPDGDRSSLETHLQHCESCRHVYNEQEGMHAVLSEDVAAWEVPADLLVESRRELADKLDRLEQKRSWWRVPAFSVVFTPMRLLESAALIAMGLALGVYVTNQQPVQQVASESNSALISIIPRDGSISNLRIVNANPTTGNIELAGEVVQPLRYQGTMDDDIVRRILMNALRDASNPGSRLRAVEVLSSEATDESVEEALINALIYDENSGIRLAALNALKASVNDEHVKTAFMHSLANDEIAGIRVEAIEALTRSKDAALAESIQELTKEEDNPYIRMKVLQFVGTNK